MKKEYITTGKTVEEAMAKAYATYGSEGDVSCRVLKQPKKGFLGIGGTDAEVAVTVTTDDDEGFSLESVLGKAEKKQEAPAPRQEQKKPEQKPAAKEAKPAESAKQPTAAKENAAPADGEARPEGSGNRRKRHRGGRGHHGGDKSAAQNQPAEKQAPVQQPKPQQQPKSEPKHRDEEPVTVTEEEMACAIRFAETLIRSMDLEATVVRQTAEDGTPLPRINIEGDETGVLIGHHGETLDAIQYLINLSANRKGGGDGREFVKIAVDVENYRAKREETLRALARRMADRCKKYKKNIVLEPMNPYERRIIHSEIQDIPDVSTHSVGYDENRKIVITYEGADKPAEPNRRNRSRRGRGGQGGQGSFQRERTPEIAPEDRPPEYPEDIGYDESADSDYTYEKTTVQPKPEKMSFEDFAAAGTDDIPMGILSEK